MVTYSADDLREYADSTNAMLAAGVSVPLLKKHAPLGADDHETNNASATDGAGWLKRIKRVAGGALAAILDVTDTDAAKGIANGSIKFTSPELREGYEDGKGRRFNRIFRHFALTPTPRNPDQGAFKAATAFAEAIQFSLGDYEDTMTTAAQFMDDDKAVDDAESAPVIDVDDVESVDTPETGPDPAEVAQHVIEMYGVKIPDGSDMSTPDGWLHLLIALMNKKQDGDGGVTPPPDPMAGDTAVPPPQTSTEPQQFDEANMTPVERALLAKLRAAEKQNAQFSEHMAAERKAQATAKAKARRGEVEATIKASKVAPATRKKLLDLLSTAQFAESVELPTMTIGAVLRLIESTIPPGLRFSEGDTKSEEHPNADFMATESTTLTADKAEALYTETHKGWKNTPAKAGA